MLIPVSSFLKRLALLGDEGYMGDSPYLNIPIYQQQTDPSDSSQDIGMGPPSMYDEPDESTRTKNVEDIRRKGERPTPSDRLERNILPVTVTNIGSPWENLQGGPWNDTTTPDGRNENRDTIGFDPDELTVNPFRD